ncbi:DUF1127 domain-containing protein [Psychromonas hadalis]|uniref:DUF1127 domain-containing protein n=1 Tax=Psychromonas hadalis TaxID=211669 RepID=UPI0003B7ACA3|nr:DUF1127 domain-containing protein [Psychromonas hadalis]
MRKIITRINRQISLFDTRKQLLNLPEHLLKDIAISAEQRLIETKKMAFFPLLKRLIKGD